MPIDPITAINSIWGASTAEDLLSITAGGAGNEAEQAAKLSIGAMEREVKRIRGHKLVLTPADNERLAKLQERIQLINQRTSDGEVRADELEERTELYREADKILGKPSADVESDDTLESLNVQIHDLLLPRLNPAQAKRLELLETMSKNLTKQLDEDSSSLTARRQFQNVSRQIKELTTARQIHELSISERNQYDDLVEQVNSHAKAKLELHSREAIRVYQLEKAIEDLKASLPPDTADQPSSAAVARAYTRLF
mgnify:CR=1 FL=1